MPRKSITQIGALHNKSNSTNDRTRTTTDGTNRTDDTNDTEPPGRVYQRGPVQSCQLERRTRTSSGGGLLLLHFARRPQHSASSRSTLIHSTHTHTHIHTSPSCTVTILLLSVLHHNVLALLGASLRRRAAEYQVRTHTPLARTLARTHHSERSIQRVSLGAIHSLTHSLVVDCHRRRQVATRRLPSARRMGCGAGLASAQVPTSLGALGWLEAIVLWYGHDGRLVPCIELTLRSSRPRTRSDSIAERFLYAHEQRRVSELL